MLISEPKLFNSKHQAIAFLMKRGIVLGVFRDKLNKKDVIVHCDNELFRSADDPIRCAWATMDYRDKFIFSSKETYNPAKYA